MEKEFRVCAPTMRTGRRPENGQARLAVRHLPQVQRVRAGYS